MIPISRNQHISTTIDGVTYNALPPVGDLEMKLFKFFDTTAITPAEYAKAETELVAEYAGNRKPKKTQWEKLIKERAIENGDTEDYVGKMGKLLNLVLVSWDSTEHDLPDFINGDCAADIPTALKTNLFNWYWSQFNVDVEEAKN